jgi:dihydrofolate reductase
MKTVLLMTMSANGYIARPNDEAPWSREEFERCTAYAKQAGNIIVGRRTYELMQEDGDFDSSILTVVVSRDIREPHGNVVYVSSPQHAIAYVHAQGHATAVLGGGASIASGALIHRLVDEVILDIEPLMFAKGIRLTDEAIPEVRLDHLKTEQFGDTVRLHYRVRK